MNKFLPVYIVKEKEIKDGEKTDQLEDENTGEKTDEISDSE